MTNKQIDIGHHAICSNCKCHFDFSMKVTSKAIELSSTIPYAIYTDAKFIPSKCPHCESIIQDVSVYADGTIIANVKEV